VWDDNLNFDVFSSWFAQAQTSTPDAPSLSLGEQDEAHQRLARPSPRTRLDIALVVDVTGSMSDELAYLQVEFAALADEIAAAWPDTEPRWSLVLYRDRGDAFVTRTIDFTTATAVRHELACARAEGGGDTPEAVAAALDATVGLSWRRDPDVARLAFWLADAPHHRTETQAVTDSLRQAAALDVHLYPVASSGTDGLTELLLRSAAQLTGGRYLFLTDDSGVGGSHAEPSIPCYFVTLLNDAVLRMVDIEMSGAWREPDGAQILRTGGDPQDGRCVLPDGREVAIF
jgi:hypothetical protein